MSGNQLAVEGDLEQMVAKARRRHDTGACLGESRGERAQGGLAAKLTEDHGAAMLAARCLSPEREIRRHFKLAGKEAVQSELRAATSLI
jgi:hypothetical protein